MAHYRIETTKSTSLMCRANCGLLARAYLSPGCRGRAASQLSARATFVSRADGGFRGERPRIRSGLSACGRTAVGPLVNISMSSVGNPRDSCTKDIDRALHPT